MCFTVAGEKKFLLEIKLPPVHGTGGISDKNNMSLAAYKLNRLGSNREICGIKATNRSTMITAIK